MKKQALSLILCLLVLFSAIFLPSCQTAPARSAETVGNQHFLFLSYRTYSRDVQKDVGKTESVYHIVLSGQCRVNLVRYRLTAKLFDKEDVLLTTLERTIFKTCVAFTDLSDDFEISEDIYNRLDHVEVEYEGISNLSLEKDTYNVSFVVDSSVSSVRVKNGDPVGLPDPPKKNHYIFQGWYTDSKFQMKYDFSEGVFSDLKLYAKFTLDSEELSRVYADSAAHTSVKVENKSYNRNFGIETDVSVITGSGVVIGYENGTYYLLTNCHIARRKQGCKEQKLTVQDDLGNSYPASVFKNAIDETYDLACLTFRKEESNPVTAKLALKDPALGRDVVSADFSGKQDSGLVFGQVNNYLPLNPEKFPDYLSSVDFPALTHSAFGGQGSDGSALWDPDLNLVGINYAAVQVKNESYVGYAIPVSRIREFLETYAAFLLK